MTCRANTRVTLYALLENKTAVFGCTALYAGVVAQRNTAFLLRWRVGSLLAWYLGEAVAGTVWYATRALLDVTI